jgi:hypothetical protein
MGHGQTYKRSVTGSIVGSLVIAAAVVTALELIETTLPLPVSAPQASAHAGRYAVLSAKSVELAR